MLGVVLIFLAIATTLSLLLPNTGVLGAMLHGVFGTLFGNGAWAAPVVLVFLGVGSISGKRAGSMSQLVWGLILLFVTLLGVFARTYQGEFFEPGTYEVSGGLVGAIIAWCFEKLLGDARYVGMGALGVVGLVLCANTSVRAILAGLGDRRFEPRPLKPASQQRALIQTPVDVDEDDEPVRETPKVRTPIIRETQNNSAGVTLSTGTSKEGYKLPPISLLAEPAARPKRSQQEMQRNIETLESTLEEFGIEANVVEVATGPTVTRYEIQLGPGIRVARITALADNIAMNLAASHVRVEAPIPGKSAIGVEVPNAVPTPVNLRSVCDNADFLNNSSRLATALGQDVSGANKYADLARMPHLLIGGATNSGKSVGLSSIVMSLLLRNTPKQVRFVMIDPKRVELAMFDRIPHLLCPVIKDVHEAPGVLRAVWREMDRRYEAFSGASVRNIDGWNAKASFQDRMPYIVVVVDELADLMIQAAAEIETSICRIAQLARATGIHLVVATQRPSVDVITGTIKANISSRVAYTVSSQVDSRTILDQKGAEALIGRGDMLFLPIDASKPIRIQGCYVSEPEIEAVCQFWRDQEGPNYVLEPVGEPGDAKRGDINGEAQESDPLWEEAVRWVADRGQASTSMLQRRFSIGFQRASRLLDLMEARNIVGQRDGPRPREVLVSPLDVDALFGTAPTYETGWVEGEN